MSASATDMVSLLWCNKGNHSAFLGIIICLGGSASFHVSFSFTSIPVLVEPVHESYASMSVAVQIYSVEPWVTGIACLAVMMNSWQVSR